MVGPVISDCGPTTFRVCEGCVFAPALFCYVIDWIMEHTSGLKGVTLGRYTVTDLDYAHDIALPASQLPDLETCLLGFSTATQSMGLNVFCTKTKAQCFDPGGISPDIEGNPVESIKSFCYLGGVQDSSGRCSLDIASNRDFGILDGLLVPNLETGKLCVS